MHKNTSISIMAVILIVVTSLLSGKYIARAEEKLTTSHNLYTGKVLSNIAQLPASKVVLQHAAEIPPANGPYSRNGTETIFEWKGVRYTLWIWDMKADPAFPEVKWARLYYRPIGSSGDKDLCSISDAYLDGIIDGGMCAETEKEPLNFLASSFHMDPKFVRSLADGPNDLKNGGREAQLAKWQQRYDVLLKDLTEFLENAQKAGRQAKR